MIDQTHVQRIKKVFGSHYANTLSKKLAEKGLLNRKQKPFSRQSLSNYLQNPERQTNTALATGILEVLIAEEKHQKELLEKLKS
ncbi:hypothetical protein SAMN05216480_12348 [Pustulibacterium marinum]|uniref:Uncharacterized protein n=1 Tax=Pustulibacterium marinum TaxID=1224947 RepID=A0A1I7IWR1_9FLAO|nr:hypothetical protein [Pustulibacterium marinum]SFU77363.1 hypothetical protein SAMN05216480_12348 [Pustulibacterium marinum]